jgi:WD40 repeat protein
MLGTGPEQTVTPARRSFGPADGGATHTSSPVPPRTPPAIPDHDLLRCIGRGSYGEVWLARNVMGTYRAVKIVYRATFDSDRPYEREFDGLKKFEPVSRAHESQVALLHVGRNDREGYFYHIMELADDQRTGQQIDADRYEPKTLRSELKARARLPFGDGVRIGLALTTALEHLHKHGLIHRDIKPSNIIFVNGLPKLADIGLVATVDATCSYVGTEGYLPPEGPGTPQADLYSLGKVLYEISTGKDRRDFPELPLELDSSEEGKGVVEFNAVVVKACKPAARDRYKSASQMREDLLLLLAGKSVRRTHAMERRLVLMTRIGVGAVAIMVLGAFPYYLAIKEAQRARQEAAHARQAEADGQEKLRRAYLAEAQAGRWSHRAGRRFESLNRLKQAAQIRPSLELRNEAIACLALTDLRLARQWLEQAAGTPDFNCDFDPNYGHYAINDSGGTVHVRRVEDGFEEAQFPGYGGNFKATAFSPDGKLLLIACTQADDRIDLLEFDSHRPILRFSGKRFRAAGFSTDSRLLAISFNEPSNNFPIRIFDLSLGREVASVSHMSLPFMLLFNPKQPNLLVTSDSSPAVRVWDWREGRVIQTLIHPNWITGVDWHPDGQTLATACADHQVYLWDLASGKKRAAMLGHEDAAVRVSFNSDGRFLVSRGRDGLLFLWDPITQRDVVSMPIPGVSYHLSNAADRCAIWMGVGKLGLVEVEASDGYRVLRRDFEGDHRGIGCDFSPDGRRLVSTDPAGIYLWDLKTDKEIARAGEPTWEHGAVFSPDGAELLLDTRAGIERWRFDSGLENPSTNGFNVGSGRPICSPSDNGGAVFSRDRRTVAVATHDRLHVCDIATGQERCRLDPKYGSSYIFAALDTEGNLAATWFRSATNVLVWDVSASKVVRSVPAHPYSHASFSPNGQWLAVGDEEELRVWDTHTWQALYSLPRVKVQFYGYHAFSPDSRVLALAISRGNVRLVEAASGQELATLEGPDRMDIRWMSFSIDGSQLAVVSGTGLIQLWDLHFIRQELAAMALDWELPHLPSPYQQQAAR